jgi:hypothetical protein
VTRRRGSRASGSRASRRLGPRRGRHQQDGPVRADGVGAAGQAVRVRRVRAQLVGLLRLHQWCAAQVGLSTSRSPSRIAGGALPQRGTTLTVEQAKRTRGALLFRQRGGGANDHVVISLGDGNTIEAMGRAYGVRTGKVVAGRDWTSGGWVPGMHVNPPSAAGHQARLTLGGERVHVTRWPRSRRGSCRGSMRSPGSRTPRRSAASSPCRPRARRWSSMRSGAGSTGPRRGRWAPTTRSLRRSLPGTPAGGGSGAGPVRRRRRRDPRDRILVEVSPWPSRLPHFVPLPLGRLGCVRRGRAGQRGRDRACVAICLATPSAAALRCPSTGAATGVQPARSR